MSRKIPCEIIKDLMPLYADGLTSEVTGREIEAHLKECGECRRMYQRMKQEVEGEKEAVGSTEAEEIDYLKKVKRRNLQNVLLGAGAVFLAMALAVFIKLFIIGYPSDAYIITYTDINGSQVRVGGSFYNSASVFSRYKMVRKDDGTEEMVVYACHASPWNRNGTFNLEMGLPVEGMQMDIRGMTVKSNGEVVGRQANELFKAKNPYIGDASADGKLAGLVGISKSLGVFKNQLQTSEEPYGWTLNFEDSTSNSAMFEEKMKAFSCMLIALTGNLGEVQWNYTVELEDGPVQRSGRMTEAECSEYVGAPVKSFADSPEGVQALLDLLEISDR